MYIFGWILSIAGLITMVSIFGYMYKNKSRINFVWYNTTMAVSNLAVAVGNLLTSTSTISYVTAATLFGLSAWWAFRAYKAKKRQAAEETNEEN